MDKTEISICFKKEEAEFIRVAIEALSEHAENIKGIPLLEGIRNKFRKQAEVIAETENTNDKYEEIIEEYNDKVFWKELIERLATKEMIRQYGKNKIEKMSDNEFEKKFEAIEDPIIKEITDNGIGNIIINKKI